MLAPDSVLVYPVPDGRAATALPFFYADGDRCRGRAVGVDRWDATPCETWPEGAHVEVLAPMPAPVEEPAATAQGG